MFGKTDYIDPPGVFEGTFLNLADVVIKVATQTFTLGGEPIFT